MTSKTTLAIRILAFTLPPLLLGLWTAVFELKAVMTLPEYSLEAPSSAPHLPRTHTKLATILLGDSGSQLTDVAATYEVLGRSKKFDLRSASLSQTPVPLTTHLWAIPDQKLESEKGSDWIVLPSQIGVLPQLALDYLLKQTREGKKIFAPSDASAILASLGLLDGKKATAHVASLEAYRERFPKVQWQESRVVYDPPFLTTSGITGAIDGALEILNIEFGSDLRNSVATEIGYTVDLLTPRAAPGFMDYSVLLLNAGFNWLKTQVGVLIPNRVSELALAGVLDPFARTLSTQIVSLGIKPEGIRSLHGLNLIPRLNLKDSPKLDYLFRLNGEAETIPDWFKARAQNEVNLLTQFKPWSVWEWSMNAIGSIQGPRSVESISKFIEYPRMLEPREFDSAGFETSPWLFLLLWLRPLLIGFVCLWIWFKIEPRVMRFR